MKKILIMLLLCSHSLFATTFYVSTDGDDSNDGLTISTSWKTINKVNQGNFSNGDIILFKRGNIFRGALDVPQNACVFGAYGTGANPTISGAVALSGWSAYSGSIYKTVLAGTKIPNHLYVNGKLMTIARYPNTGWLETGAGSSDKKTINNNILGNLAKPSGYWNGANVHIRTFSWLFENRIVASSQNNGTLTLNSDLTQTNASTINPGWGFYLDNKLSELDAPGEWFFDNATKTIYLFAPNGQNPSSQLVEAAVEDIGIKIFFKNNTRVQDLTTTMQKQTGIQPWLSDGVTITNCIIEKSGAFGIEQPWNCKDLQITNNKIRDCLDYGIFWNEDGGFDNGANLIQGNQINRIGMVAGYGGDGVVHYIGVRTRGKNINFKKNTIDSTGYVCMTTEANNSIIEKNVFNHSQMLLDDGGALFINANNQTIRNNFFLNSYGNRDISSGLYNGQNFRIMGMGIFSQPGYSGSVIENNVFAHNRDNGLYLDQHGNATVKNNLMFNNLTQMQLTDNGGTKANLGGNTLYSLLPNQTGLVMEDNNPFTYANTFNNAFYGNPYNKKVIKAGNINYTLKEWRNAFPSVDITADSSKIFFPFVDSLTAISKHLFLTNPSDNILTVDLGGKTYRQLNGSYVCGNSISVAPWTAQLLILDEEAEAVIYTTANVLAQTATNVNLCKWYHIRKNNQSLVSVNPNGNNLGTVTVNTYLSSSTQFVDGAKAIKRNWVINASTAPLANVKIRLYFTNTEFNDLKLSDQSITSTNELVVRKYNGLNEDNTASNNSSATTNIVGATFIPYQDGFYAEVEVNGFSEFWITSVAGLLPINQVNFKVAPQNNNVRLSWQTAEEKNSSHFEIERAFDGISYTKIGSIEAQQNSSALVAYNFLDNQTQFYTGELYYRLKMVDMDGSFTYSEIKAVKLNLEPTFDVTLYPNPVINTLTIQMLCSKTGIVNYTVNNSLGQILLSGNYAHDDLKSHQTLDVSNFSSGVYFIRLLLNNDKKTIKFIKL